MSVIDCANASLHLLVVEAVGPAPRAPAGAPVVAPSPYPNTATIVRIPLPKLLPSLYCDWFSVLHNVY
jgi:hypothetical protein